ncbi:MAG: hypothetical protein AAF399_01245 [Bacteroidota bacterium]
MKHFFPYLLSVVFLLVSLFLGSCTGYPDGPSVSFTSALTKISTTWRVKQAVLNNTEDVTTDYETEYFKFDEDGEFETLEARYQISLPPFTQDTIIPAIGSGTWRFLEEETMVELLYGYRFRDPYNSDIFYTEEQNERYEIRRLAEDELWLSNDSLFLKLEFFSQ